MASSYTSLLGFVLPVTGELSGSWGSVWNDSGTSLIDNAIAGTTTLSTDADVTLTTSTGVSNEARQAIILWNPASGTVTRNITAPAQSKIYTVINASGGTQSIVIRGAGPTTGVTIIKGESAVVAWNGSDFVKISSAAGDVTMRNLAVTGTLTVAGATTLGDAVGDAVTVNGTATFVNANPTLSAGTANGVTYLNGSKVLTSGAALTFDGANLGVGTSAPNYSLTAYKAGATDAYLQVVNGATGSGAGNGLLLGVDSSANGVINYQGATNLYTYVGGTLRTALNSTGLGIGTASPTAKLDVVGTAAISGSVTLSGGTANGVAYLNGSKVLTSGTALTFDGTNLVTTGSLYIANAQYLYGKTSAATSTRMLGINGANDLYFGSVDAAVGNIIFTNNGEQMRLTSTGLGIGTSSPTEKLDVGGASPVIKIGRASGNQPKLSFGPTSATDFYLQASSATGILRYDAGPSAAWGGIHAWYVDQSEQMRLTSTGLGIGTSSPSYRLDVYGSGTPVAAVRSSASGDAKLYLECAGTNSGYVAYNRSLQALTFSGNNSTNHAILDSAGNLGLGVTSPGDKLEIGGSGAGIILASPNGTRYRITVSDLGVLTVAAA